MKTFVTSDLHFDHKNIMTFCPRTRSRFSDVNHMNESMMEEWNDTASPEDLTFILGDIAFCNAEKAIAYLKSSNLSYLIIPNKLEDFEINKYMEELFQTQIQKNLPK